MTYHLIGKKREKLDNAKVAKKMEQQELWVGEQGQDDGSEEQRCNILEKVRTRMPHDPAIPLPGIHSVPTVNSVGNLAYENKGDSTKVSTVLFSILLRMLVSFTHTKEKKKVLCSHRKKCEP